MISRKRRWVGRFLRAVPPPIRDFAVRRTTPSYIMGAMCRVERDDGRVLLVKPSYRSVWTLPGGVSERGETPIDCMRRELREETGLQCEVIGEPVILVDPKRRIFDFVYRARLAPDVRPDDARAVSLDICRPKRYCALSILAVVRLFRAEPNYGKSVFAGYIHSSADTVRRNKGAPQNLAAMPVEDHRAVQHDPVTLAAQLVCHSLRGMAASPGAQNQRAIERAAPPNRRYRARR